MDNIAKDRGYLVVKSNDLIQRTRYNLNPREQKIILYLISKIKPEDDSFKEYSLDITEFCRICGINIDGGRDYQAVRDTVQGLRDKSFWIQTETAEILCSWINKVTIQKFTSTITIRLDEDLKPYLLQLKDNFTAYELEYSLALHGKYTLRLYEMLRSYAYQGKWVVSLSAIREKLDLGDKYTLYAAFRRRVIEPAIDEINTYTDLKVTVLPQKQGKTIVGLTFTIIKKKYIDYPTTARNIRRRLD